MVVERIPDRADSTRTKAGTLDAEMSLVELLDGLVMFYHISAHKQIAKVTFIFFFIKGACVMRDKF